jgi:drug/metabolite transporter (DMT)-like permease
MINSDLKKPVLQLHAAVFLFGFAAILGDLIQLSPVVLVWWRLLITIVSLALLVPVASLLRKIERKYLVIWMGIGILVASHWIAFFASIKWANASVALVCLATATVFTSFIEPWVNRASLQIPDIILATLVVPCMILIVADLDIKMMSGVLAGLLSAILLSLFGVLNKKFVLHADPMFITFVELSSGWFFLGFFLLFFKSSADSFMPQQLDWLYLVLLALGCTTLGYVLMLHALKSLSAYTTMLAFNLEPVYGMFFAFFILDDARELSTSFYIGGLLIIALIFIHPIITKKIDRKIQKTV